MKAFAKAATIQKRDKCLQETKLSTRDQSSTRDKTGYERSNHPPGIQLFPKHKTVHESSNYPQGIKLSPKEKTGCKVSNYLQGIKRAKEDQIIDKR
jgi:hypothetical protein